MWAGSQDVAAAVAAAAGATAGAGDTPAPTTTSEATCPAGGAWTSPVGFLALPLGLADARAHP